MRTRRDRDIVLFGMGVLILAVLCGGGLCFMEGLLREFRKAYVWVGGIFLHMARERTVRRCFHTS